MRRAGAGTCWRLGVLGGGLAAALAAAVAPMAGPDEGPVPRVAPAHETWSPERVRELTAAGRPVFVNFTAAWCITCKVNERVALATADTRQLFAERSVAYLVADWTRRSPAITRALAHHGRNGVPLYLLYPPTAGPPVVLPQLLTEGLVADALRNI